MTSRHRQRSQGASLASLTTSIVLCGLLMSCRSVDESVGIPPLFEIYKTPSTIEWIPSTPGGERAYRQGREAFLRPFGSWEFIGEDRRRLRIAYPFVDFHWTPEETHHRISPIFRHQSLEKNGGGRDNDTALFPLFFWGSDPEEGGYFAFFPFGGTIKGLFGLKRADFVLFPLFTRARRDGRVSDHWLWPFMNFVSGAGWSGGRFWPFYGSYEWQTEDGELRAQRKFIFWPFYIRNREHLHRDPTEVFFSFPFYGYRENSRSLQRDILWPFYTYHYDKKHDTTLQGGFAFPYRFTKNEAESGASIDQADYWPIWGTKVEKVMINGQNPRRRFRQFALWPIQRYDRAEDDGESTRRLWVMPFWYDFYRLDKIRLESERKWKLWPLMGYRSTEKTVAFDLFSVMWNDRREFERLYGRLFSIFRYRSRPTYEGWEVLWGTLYWHKKPSGSLFSVLGGLVEIGADEKDAFPFRLLWLPWRL